MSFETTQPDPALQPQPEPPPEPQPEPYIRNVRAMVRDYFFIEVPTFGVAVVPLCFLSMLLFTRHPTKTNFIFDEQEALLANPYVRSIADPIPKLRWIDAFHRDFWGLLPDRSIGSYRPIPDLIWRALWGMGAREQTPFLHHWVNVLLHGVNGALLVTLAWKLTGRRGFAWLSGAIFVACAVSTEAVTGVVGIADVLGTMGCLLALHALFCEIALLPLAIMGATLFGLLCKETVICIVPMIPFAALCFAGMTHPERPRPWVRAAIALLATVSAFVLYVEGRRRAFPVPLPHQMTLPSADASLGQRVLGTVLHWYQQPALPKDPINNPLVDASTSFRVAGALRVYTRGLLQIIYPVILSGDYSAPSEPIPDALVFPESIAGALALVVPICTSLYLALFTPKTPAIVQGRRAPRDDRPIVAFSLLWVVASFLPVSNIPVLLPTVRAERFWYLPALATSMLLAICFERLVEWSRPRNAELPALLTIMLFFSFQGFAARRHANDYRDDLGFWEATRRAVPDSAKAELNYSVMLGSRGDLDGRVHFGQKAVDLEPKWPMAQIYMGDILCRMHKTAEAWPSYERGFELGPNDKNLIGLALQCLWDEHALDAGNPIRDELDAVADRHPGTWIENMVRDIMINGEKFNGVDPKNRPRAYNEGPKGD